MLSSLEKRNPQNEHRKNKDACMTDGNILEDRIKIKIDALS